MAEKVSEYSQRSAKKTLIFVIVLLGVAVVFAIVAIYMLNKQSSVLIQSSSFEQHNATGPSVKSM